MGVDWRKSSWEVEFTAMDELIEKMRQIPDRSEHIINKVLSEKSSKEVVKSIETGIPISDVKKRITTKKHAKDGQPLKIEMMNLGFKVRPKRQYEYLKYPDLAIGTSVRKIPQEFMRKGMEKEVTIISSDLMIALMREIEK